MLQTADSEEYDFSGESPKASEKQRPVKEVAEEESEKEESTSGSVEFLPGTSSRPLVLVIIYFISFYFYLMIINNNY